MKIVPSEHVTHVGDCKICGRQDAKNDRALLGPGDLYEYSCPRCGSFKIEKRFLFDGIIDDAMRPYLSAATRQASTEGRVLVLTGGNWRELAEPHSQSSVSRRIEKLLRVIADGCKRPGRLIEITFAQDCSLCDASDEGELTVYLEHLQSKGLVNKGGAGVGKGLYGLLIAGWEAVEPRIGAGGIAGRCFVAMWFDDSMKDAYDRGFAPGISDAGFTPIRIDQKLTNKGISDEIKAEIRMAQFTVADFTGQRQSVYYEAGFANGLGREVIWCCRTDDVNKLHFDIKHLGHVVWKDAVDLRKRLTDSIRANIIKSA